MIDKKQIEPLLEIKELRISFPTMRRKFEAVRGVSLRMGREKIGIVGESGSGKSLTGRAILKLNPKIAHVTAQKMRFDEIDLLKTGERQMRALRGKRISMILQDPKYSLNPLLRIGDQIMEAYRIHHKVTKAAARRLACDCFSLESINSFSHRGNSRIHGYAYALDICGAPCSCPPLIRSPKFVGA